MKLMFFFSKIPLDEARRIVERKCAHPEEIVETINAYLAKGVSLFSIIFKKDEDIRPFVDKVIKKI